MSDEIFQRRVFRHRDEIPPGTKALIVNVRVPIMTLVADEEPDAESVLYDERKVYVEITPDEWAEVKDDRARADELVKQFGPLVQRALGASWHRWLDENNAE